jgi:hypothetical protein
MASNTKLIDKVKKHAAAATKRAEEKKQQQQQEQKAIEGTAGDELPLLIREGDEPALIAEWKAKVEGFMVAYRLLKTKWKDLTIGRNIMLGPGRNSCGFAPLYIPEPAGNLWNRNNPSIVRLAEHGLAEQLAARYKRVVVAINDLNDEKKEPIVEFNFAMRGAVGMIAAIVDTWEGFPPAMRVMITAHQNMVKGYIQANLKPGRYLSVDLVGSGLTGIGVCQFSTMGKNGAGLFIKRATIMKLGTALGGIMKGVLSEDIGQGLLDQLPLVASLYAK